jgi:predicted nucleic acid-binding protein
VVSTQVLQEFYVTITRKMPVPVDAGEARELIEQYGAWRLQVIDLADIVRACDLQQRYRFSFWDALIVTSAHTAGARTLLSEDLQSGFQVMELQIVNPFLQ